MPGNIINLDASDIAKWPEPNYTNPDRRHWMPQYAGVLFGVATLMVATRLCLRAKRYSGGLGVDDVLLIFAWASLGWFTSLSIVGAEKYMTSRHMWDIPLSMYENMTLITWIAELAFLVTGCCVKVSVLLFYRKLGANSMSKYWIWTVMAAIAFTVSYSLAFILTLVFNCSPTAAYWKSFNPAYTVNYTCVNTTVINLLAGITSAVSDLYAVVLPCIMTRHLQLPKQQKFALYIIFCLGLLAVAASGVRTYWMYKVGHSSDVSTSIFYVFVWAQLELSLGIICTALPSLRVLFREYLSNPLSKLRRTVTTSHSRRLSDVEEAIIRPGNADAHNVHRKHTPASSVSSDTSSIHELPTASQSSGSCEPPETSFIKTPADYEMYNLRNMEKYRESTHSRLPADRPGASGSDGDRSGLEKSWLDTEML